MLASVDVNILHEGIAGALLQHALRYSCRSRSVVYYASVCFKLIFALICLSRVLVLLQSCISSQRLPGRWRILVVFLFAAATWSLADIVAFSSAAATWSLGGWMLCFLQRLPSRLRMDAVLSTGSCFATTTSPTLCWRPLRGCIFLLQA